MSNEIHKLENEPFLAATAIRRHARSVWILGIMALAMTVLSAQPAAAMKFCSQTARYTVRACTNEVQDNYWIQVGNCTNISDAGKRTDCNMKAFTDFRDGMGECREQYQARIDLCGDLGEDRYEPDFDPGNFETEFNNLNLYFPLAVGNTWVYEGGDENITVEVLDETKLIDGVTCIVVNDLVEVDGAPIENTDDWYGQASNGDVHYCGEIALSLETFPGDDPEQPELVDIEGSWKAGRDHAKPGIIMFGFFPEIGTVYRQEISLGDAEDVAELLSVDYNYGDDEDLDQFVPQALAELLCHHDCVVTLDYTPIEPDVAERKYYAPGIGLFLEANVEEGEVTKLVGCSHHPACLLLPAPESAGAAPAPLKIRAW